MQVRELSKGVNRAKREIDRLQRELEDAASRRAQEIDRLQVRGSVGRSMSCP
jgi:hypothetical protein